MNLVVFLVFTPEMYAHRSVHWHMFTLSHPGGTDPD